MRQVVKVVEECKQSLRQTGAQVRQIELVLPTKVDTVTITTLLPTGIFQETLQRLNEQHSQTNTQTYQSIHSLQQDLQVRGYLDP